MGLLVRFRASVAGAFRAASRRAATILRSSRAPAFPLAERLLADALRIGELPSPTAREEQRAAFVLERLRSRGLAPQVDEEGNVLVRLACPDPRDPRPILVLAELVSRRWHPLESLSRLDADRAYGAGLADSLGPAALLSLAESLSAGGIPMHRDVLLLFAARPLADPGARVLSRLAEDPQNRPAAALVARGLSLGSVLTKPLGTYRIEIRVRTDAEEPDAAPGPGSAVDAVVALARTFSGITWDAEKRTTCAIRRIEAGAGFGHEPTEGVLALELESSDEAVLEVAMKAAVATAESRGRAANLRTRVSIAGYVPVGDPGAGAGLARLAIQALKEQHIKAREEAGADSAAFLSSRGIPAVTLAVASGREGLDRDEIEVASIEKGRRLLASVLERASAEDL